MADDPKYVRLANRLTRGIVADVHGSGWSIAGLDVKEFPKDNKAAAKFVRRALNEGKVEEASRAEFDEAHSEDDSLLEAIRKENPHYDEDLPVQEGKLREVARKAQQRVEDARRGEVDPEEEYDREVRQPRQARRRGGNVSTDMSKAELQEAAESRGLSTSGSKQELADRIAEYDAQQG